MSRDHDCRSTLVQPSEKAAHLCVRECNRARVGSPANRARVHVGQCLIGMRIVEVHPQEERLCRSRVEPGQRVVNHLIGRPTVRCLAVRPAAIAVDIEAASHPRFAASTAEPTKAAEKAAGPEPLGDDP